MGPGLFPQELLHYQVIKEAWWDPFEGVYKLKLSTGELEIYEEQDRNRLSRAFFTINNHFLPAASEKKPNKGYTVKGSVKWRKIVLIPPVNILYIIPFYLVEKSGWESVKIQ